METTNPPPPQANPEMVPPPPPFLANMGLAQIQALGLLGYLPPFAPLNFLPPNMNVPLDLSKSGYEPLAVPPPQDVQVQASQTICPDQTSHQEDMEIDPGPEQRNPDQDTSTVPPERVPSPQSGSGSPQDDNRKPFQERQRQKRQTLQDMTRPLKQWLYQHRENPYPNKSEKVQLAKSSQMTMTQVSNWFANARRRLKNTVRDPDITWAKRIKMYNSYAEGNQELLSIGSSSSDDEVPAVSQRDCEQGSRVEELEESGEGHHTQISQSSALVHHGQQQTNNLLDRLTGNAACVSPPQSLEPLQPSPLQDFSTIAQASQRMSLPTDTTHTMLTAPQLPPPQQAELHAAPQQRLSAISGDEGSLDDSETPPKYKNSIMQRYLNDSYQSAMQSLNTLVTKGDPKEKERHRNPSGSLSSHDYEEYMSSASSARSTPTREHQDGHIDEYEEFSRHWPDIKTRAEDDLYWKEISAALALTSLARSRYATPSH